jgi:hypothetical protein
MAMSETAKKVWSADPAGFEGQLNTAYEHYLNGKFLAANVLYASAYYSHFKTHLVGKNPFRWFLGIMEFQLSRKHARLAAGHIFHIALPGSVSHGEYDTVATPFLRSWFIIRPDPKIAERLLKDGLALSDVPAHSRALMTIGLAEASYFLGKPCEDIQNIIERALRLEPAVFKEDDRGQALLQFARVFSRAATLYYHMGFRDTSANCHLSALDCVTKAEEEKGINLDYQRAKYGRAWSVTKLPGFVRFFLPQ